MVIIHGGTLALPEARKLLRALIDGWIASIPCHLVQGAQELVACQARGLHAARVCRRARGQQFCV